MEIYFFIIVVGLIVVSQVLQRRDRSSRGRYDDSGSDSSFLYDDSGSDHDSSSHYHDAGGYEAGCESSGGDSGGDGGGGGGD